VNRRKLAIATLETNDAAFIYRDAVAV